MDCSTLEKIIKAEIPDADVQVQDRGDGQNFSARIESGIFKGMTRIQQHRRVHHVVDRYIGQDILSCRITTCARA